MEVSCFEKMILGTCSFIINIPYDAINIPKITSLEVAGIE